MMPLMVFTEVVSDCAFNGLDDKKQIIAKSKGDLVIAVLYDFLIYEMLVNY